MTDKSAHREVLFELHRIGSVVRVSAIDAERNVEVTIQGPVRAGEAALKKLALRKLDYVLSKLGGEKKGGEGKE